MKHRAEPSPSNPHPLLVFAGSGSQELASKIAKFTGSELGDAITDPHPNGECMVRVDENVRSRDVFVVQSLCRRDDCAPPFNGINDNLMELLIWGDTLSLASARRVTAVIPYFGYSRQDRKARSRTPITARLICDVLQTAGFDRVLTVDLHSDQIQGFFDRKTCILDHLNAGELFTNYFNGLSLKNAVVLSPDIGNVKKADKYRRGMSANIGMAVIDKRRDQHTGQITAERITGDSVTGKQVILLDDIISTAGTMRQAIDLAIEQGAAEFYIAATHGEFIGKALDRLNHPAIKEICVTDTIPFPCPKIDLPIKIVSVAELFGEAILRIHRGESISELLGIFG